ncbi:MAG: hypothetical protein HYS13_01480, partial [Planctomycetia bacterium]|nr:hypothetical protein [Planctomycetia bacterium]
EGGEKRGVPSEGGDGQDGFKFTCAMFRIHPRTREFQIFAEGTSNPWGIAFDTEGSAFISACVIDHLWHIVETGYYHRQGGAYPPFTWKMESIVKHKHQKAAYCGLHFFDSDAYPEKYRERLYLGNIHGGCINVDKLQRDGSTYFATPEPDFLTANDAWFMPVVQKTGPDGCLYILDWYDRYHCYQDANRDPAGIERQKGRLYRVRYTGAKKTDPMNRVTTNGKPFDLLKESDDELIARLGSPNVFFRDAAQRVLAERNTPGVRQKLEALLKQEDMPRKARMHALWARIACGGTNATASDDGPFLDYLVRSRDGAYCAWGIRAAGDYPDVDGLIWRLIGIASRDARSPDVLLQAAIYYGKQPLVSHGAGLMQVLKSCGSDKVIPHIVWQNLHPLLDSDAAAQSVLKTIDFYEMLDAEPVAAMMPRVLERLLARRKFNAELVRSTFDVLTGPHGNVTSARQCLAVLAAKVQTREIQGDQLQALREAIEPLLAPLLAAGAAHPLGYDAAMLAVSWKDPRGLDLVRTEFVTRGLEAKLRVQALEALVAAGDPKLLDAVAAALSEPTSAERTSAEFRGQVLAALGRMNDDRVAEVVLAEYQAFEPEVRPRAVELLTQRPSWAKKLLAAIGRKEIDAAALNENQVRRLLATKDEDLKQLVAKTWGTIRTERDPKREEFVARMRRFVRENPGDAERGIPVYNKVCGQCHKLFGQGQEVGPDITVNGRASYEQLLSNVFDPSLVIGASYQARTVLADDGRTVTGLVVEESDQRAARDDRPGPDDGGAVRSRARLPDDDLRRAGRGGFGEISRPEGRRPHAPPGAHEALRHFRRVRHSEDGIRLQRRRPAAAFDLRLAP